MRDTAEQRHSNPKFKNYIRLPSRPEEEPGPLVETPMKEIYEEIFLYENFISKDLEGNYLNILNKAKNWNVHGNYETGDYADKFWVDKLSPDYGESFALISKVSNLITPEFMAFPHSNFIRMLPGDSCEQIHCSKTPEGVQTHEYEIGVYLGEFDGGKLVFPEIDFTYQPKARDLIMFKADMKYRHYITEVISGIRYCWMSFGIRHPGYVAL